MPVLPQDTNSRSRTKKDFVKLRVLVPLWRDSSQHTITPLPKIRRTVMFCQDEFVPEAGEFPLCCLLNTSSPWLERVKSLPRLEQLQIFCTLLANSDPARLPFLCQKKLVSERTFNTSSIHKVCESSQRASTAQRTINQKGENLE